MPNAEIIKHAIAETMKHLMQTKPLQKISVGDIATECGITRNSFYYHFQDKFDLVNWIYYTEMASLIKHQFEQQSDSWQNIQALCALFYSERVFYQNALSITGQNSFSDYSKEVMVEFIKPQIGALYGNDQDSAACAAIFADAFVSIVSSWIVDGAKVPPEEFTRLIQKTFTMMTDHLSDA